MRIALLTGITILVCCFCFKVKAQTDQTVGNGSQTTPVTFPSGGCTYQWTNSNPSIGLPASGVGNIPAFTATNSGNGPVTATITATPQQSGFVYITNEADNTVSVISTLTQKVVATIPVLNGPFTVAISPDGSRVYVENTGASTSVATISVVDAATNQVIHTILDIDEPAYGMVVSPDGSKLYVSDSYFGTITVFNTSTFQQIAQFNPWGNYGLFQIALSHDGNTLYIANFFNNSVTLVNTLTNTNITDIQIGAGAGPWGLALSPDGSLLYVGDQTSNDVSVINTATRKIIATIPVGTSPYGLAVSPDGSHTYVANFWSNNVSIIDNSINQVTGTLNTGQNTVGVSLTPDGKTLYVVNKDANNVSLINTSNNQLITTIPVGSYPSSPNNFISAGLGCNSTPITFKITVNSSQPVITNSTVTGNTSSCVGSPSVSPDIQQFTVSGNNLTGDITATAPKGFDISLTATGGYSSGLTLKQTGGSVSSTTIYVRSSASDPVGPISGNVQITTPGANPASVAITGVVNSLPTVNPIANQTVNAGGSTIPVNFTGTGNAFTWTNDNPSIGLPANGMGNIAAFTAINNGSTPVTANITVTPAASGYAYIANKSSNNVSVINLATNTVITTIPVGMLPLGVSASPDGSRVFVTNNTDGTVSVINTATNTATATINVSPNPSTIVVSPDGSKVYVASSSPDVVSVINTTTNSITATINIGSNPPYGLAISPDGSKLYVAFFNTNTVSVISTATNTVISSITTGFPYTSGISVSPDGSKVYIANSSVSNLSVVNAATNTVITTISVGTSPLGTAISPDGSRVYVTNSNSNTVSVINTATNAVIASIPVDAYPNGISISNDGNRLYVANSNSNDVSIINTLTNAVIATIPVGSNPISFGNFISNATICPGAPTTFTITVNAIPPSITTNTASGTITACEGSPSADPNIQQFTVSGSNLTGNITATAPEGFEVSLSPGSGFGNNVVISQSAGSVNNITIYVRSAASDGGSISGTALSGKVTLISAGAADQTVAVTGTIYSAPTVDAVTNKTVTSGQSVVAINFTGTAGFFMWTNDTPGIGLAANGTGNIPSFTATNPGPNPVVATITVMPQSMSAVACAGTPITFAITVNPAPPPSITAPGALDALSTVYGTPSISDSFLLEAANLQSPVTITPPPGFEVSGDDFYYSNTLTIGGIGNLSATPVYVRLAGTTPVGTYSGNIVLSSTNVNDVDVNIPNSTVLPAPLTITADNKSKPFDTPNPPLTVTYEGFQNQDGPAQLTTQPIITTTATLSSPIGDYPITISGASSPNYDIFYIGGTLSVVPSPSSIKIPNAFTPNGDGVNDVWNIPELNSYPQCTVSVFSRNGSLVYQSHGYPAPWDGTVNGTPVPWGTYYYIIDLHADAQTLSGYVAVLR